MIDYIGKSPLERSEPLYLQIYKKLRKEIEDGVLQPGDRVESNARLAQRYGAGICTVQSALAALEREDLVERRQRLGTFVKSSGPRLSSVGLYFNGDFWHLPDMDYYRMLYGKLQEMLNEERITVRLYIGERALKAGGKLPPKMLQDARNREIQAVIAPLMERVDRHIFDELTVPMILATNYYDASFHAIRIDTEGMLTAGLQRLKEQGCRRVALFSILEAPGYAHFMAEAEKAGLEIDPVWSSKLPERNSGDSIEEIGYRACRQLLKSHPLPEGMMLYPDSFARGVFPALLAAGARIPEQCRLVVHQNEGMRLLTPFGCTLLITDPACVARAMLRHAKALVSGAVHETELLPFKIETSNEVTL